MSGESLGASGLAEHHWILSLSGGAFGLTDGFNLSSFKEVSAEWFFNLITLALLLSLIKLFNS